VPHWLHNTTSQYTWSRTANSTQTLVDADCDLRTSTLL